MIIKSRNPKNKDDMDPRVSQDFKKKMRLKMSLQTSEKTIFLPPSSVKNSSRNVKGSIGKSTILTS
jgi:hypothetical protein